MHRRSYDEQRPIAIARGDPDAEEPFGNIIGLARLTLGLPLAGVWFTNESDREAVAASGCDLGNAAVDETLRGLTVRHGGVLALEDARTVATARPGGAGGADLVSFIGAPLVMADGEVAGVLFAGGSAPRTFDDTARHVLASLARCAVSEIALRWRDARDDLTGCLTRNAFLGQLRQLHDAHERHGTPATLSFVDIDHFKSVNDRFGHAAGDIVLNRISAVCRASLGRRAVIGRIGGEEFAIALPGTALEEGVALLDALRERIADLTFAIGQTVSVTASFGVCGLNGDIANASVWCKMADAALYGAKHAGRNRLIVFRDTAGLAGKVDGPGFFLSSLHRADGTREENEDALEGRVHALFAASA